MVRYQSLKCFAIVAVHQLFTIIIITKLVTTSLPFRCTGHHIIYCLCLLYMCTRVSSSPISVTCTLPQFTRADRDVFLVTTFLCDRSCTVSREMRRLWCCQCTTHMTIRCMFNSDVTESCYGRCVFCWRLNISYMRLYNAYIK